MEEGRQEAISRLYPDSQISLIREPSNEHDPNAIAVYMQTGEKIGYLVSAMGAQPDILIIETWIFIPQKFRSILYI